MTRGNAPIIVCDYDEGMCGAWDVDHYATGASAVGGVRMTDSVRAPGWISNDLDEDYCPRHAGEAPR